MQCLHVAHLSLRRDIPEDLKLLPEAHCYLSRPLLENGQSDHWLFSLQPPPHEPGLGMGSGEQPSDYRVDTRVRIIKVPEDLSNGVVSKTQNMRQTASQKSSNNHKRSSSSGGRKIIIQFIEQLLYTKHIKSTLHALFLILHSPARWVLLVPFCNKKIKIHRH